MAVTYGGHTGIESTSSTTTSFPIDIPSGAGVGDMMLAAVVSDNSTTIATPSGWDFVHTETITSTRMTVFSREFESGDSGSVTFTGGNEKWAGDIVYFEKSEGDWNIEDSDSVANNSNATINFPTVTATADDSVLFVCFGNDDNSSITSIQTGFETPIGEYVDDDPNFGVYYKYIDTGDESGNSITTAFGDRTVIEVVLQHTAGGGGGLDIPIAMHHFTKNIGSR